MTDLLPRVTVPQGPFDPRALAPDADQVWLEIGFGAGEHLAAQAARRPDVLMLGAETFVNGVASALRHIEASGLENVRIHFGDARDLMAILPDKSIDRLFILFPDPWPKSRHRRRRLVQGHFVEEAARILKPEAAIRFATDWSEYAESALVALLASPSFAWTARSASDWRLPPVDHAPTRYERKRLGDCGPLWLEFKRTLG
ncbi:MAG TPA: tRNA (guanosine(46)-N7)-methyltransferase TrmB [Caulobacteraceae bacterium]